MLRSHVLRLCQVSALTIFYFQLFWRFKLKRVFFERSTLTGGKSLSLLMNIKTTKFALPTSFQCLNSYSGGLPENLGETTAQE